MFPPQPHGGSSTITESGPAPFTGHHWWLQRANNHLATPQQASHKHKGNNTCEVMVISIEVATSMFLHSKVVAEIACACVFLFTRRLSDAIKRINKTVTSSDKVPSDDVTSSAFDVKSSAAHGSSWELKRDARVCRRDVDVPPVAAPGSSLNHYSVVSVFNVSKEDQILLTCWHK